jgi:aspartyl protease
MAPRTLLDVPITFDVGSGRQTHAPMVQASIHGRATRLIVDTGSTDHILTIELARELGLDATPGEEGTDSTGASVASWMLGTLPAEIGGEGFELRDVVAITAPAPFPGFGIGGILSPQHLRAGAWAVLDLVTDRFILLDGVEADVTAWLTTRSPALRLLRLERQPGDATALVRASVEPNEPVVTMLDSGGKRTQFTAAAVPDAAEGPRIVTGHGVGGGASYGVELAARTLLVGGARLPVRSLIVGPAMDGRDGLVGMDTLRGTVLTVSGDASRPVLWQVAPELDAGG